MLPELFKERMNKSLGDEEFNEFLLSFDDDRRYHALRINTLKCGASVLGKFATANEQVPWEGNGYYYDDSDTPGKHPYHEAGLYYIQEPSAMAPVHFLDPKPGEKILDLCAAPGGKSTQIAVAMKGEGILVTNEINRDRAKILSLNVERLGIKNALVLNETPQHLSEVFEGYFDKILVDAPCSGEGMFRKNEEAFGEWSPENVKLCAERQAEILDCAEKMLLPGGTLVYSTCTFSVDENEQSILQFIRRHPDFHTVPVEAVGGMEAGRPAWTYATEAEASEVGNSIRLWPHKVKGEGHFLCVLKRDGELPSGEHNSYVPGGRVIGAQKSESKLFTEFAKETLDMTDKNALDKPLTAGKLDLELKGGSRLLGTIFMFGDQMYLAPENMPSPQGLKVMRPGLHLGTVKKDRFEPSHALALFLKKEDVLEAIDFVCEDTEVNSFLNGQTLRGIDKSKKGWKLITADGYSIGWAKAAGGMLKNHYPKGLRINL
jgi:NOL1/NOP2/sun family putative RNA methylase